MKFQLGIEDRLVKKVLRGEVNGILHFVREQLNEKHCREDYREFLELVVIFLGEEPPRGISFRVPGAMHQVRWMAKALYILKTFLFREVYPLSPNDLKSCREISIFLVQIYFRIWFNAPLAAKAPKEDLGLLKLIHSFAKQDREISTAVLEKLSGHLWYLVPETAALAFFDDEIPAVTKNLMVEALSQKSKKGLLNYKRIEGKQYKELLHKDIEYFISEDSNKFFSAFQIDTSFLQEDASHWVENEAYQKGKKIVTQLKVANDIRISNQIGGIETL